MNDLSQFYNIIYHFRPIERTLTLAHLHGHIIIPDLKTYQCEIKYLILGRKNQWNNGENNNNINTHFMAHPVVKYGKYPLDSVALMISSVTSIFVQSIISTQLNYC